MAKYQMTNQQKFFHAVGYLTISTLAGAIAGLFMANKKPGLTKKAQLLRTLEDITALMEEITGNKPKKQPKVVKLKKGAHLDDEQIDHIRKHGEP